MEDSSVSLSISKPQKLLSWPTENDVARPKKKRMRKATSLEMGRRRKVAVVSYQKTWSSSETWLTGCWTLCCTKLHANSPPPSPVVLHSTLRYYEYVRWNADRRRPFANRRMAGTAKQRMQLSGFEDLSVRDGRTVTAAAEAVEDEYWKTIYACHLHCAIYLLVYSCLFPSQRMERTKTIQRSLEI